MSQVDAVRRKLIAALNKPAIDAAVDVHGFERSLVEDVLVLCDNSAEKVAQQWTNWRATLTQEKNDSPDLELQEFVDWLRTAPPVTKDPRKRDRITKRKAKQAANRETKKKKR